MRSAISVSNKSWTPEANLVLRMSHRSLNPIIPPWCASIGTLPVPIFTRLVAPTLGKKPSVRISAQDRYTPTDTLLIVGGF
jgi:hypothetical protein